MDFEYTEEQLLLKESANRFVGDSYDLEIRARLVADKPGYSEANWSSFAELGWLCLGLAEEHGGFEDAAVETMLIAEAFGRGLVVEPYYSTLVTGGSLLSRAASQQQQEQLIPKIIEGKLKLAFAWAEPEHHYNLAAPDTMVVSGDNGYYLTGKKSVVFDAATADYLVVTARGSDNSGLSLLLVPADTPGINRVDYLTTDGRQASEIEFNNLSIGKDAVLGERDEALRAVEYAVDKSVAVACADAVGAMEQLVEMTCEYLKTRKQFGVTIGTFQVLQHRMADMYVNLELARSMSLYANLSLDLPDTERKKAVSLAKIQLIDSARFIGRQAIQLHGGIGMTDEFAVGHYFKRLLVFETYFGDNSYHLKRVFCEG